MQLRRITLLVTKRRDGNNQLLCFITIFWKYRNAISTVTINSKIDYRPEIMVSVGIV